MQLTTRLSKRRDSHPSRSSDRARRQPAPEPPETRAARRGGGPEDSALYTCMCGYAFNAPVTTSVGCPHCGTEQAW